jgi:hypothetical protein
MTAAVPSSTPPWASCDSSLLRRRFPRRAAGSTRGPVSASWSTAWFARATTSPLLVRRARLAGDGLRLRDGTLGDQRYRLGWERVHLDERCNGRIRGGLNDGTAPIRRRRPRNPFSLLRPACGQLSGVPQELPASMVGTDGRRSVSLSALWGGSDGDGHRPHEDLPLLCQPKSRQEAARES